MKTSTLRKYASIAALAIGAMFAGTAGAQVWVIDTIAIAKDVATRDAPASRAIGTPVGPAVEFQMGGASSAPITLATIEHDGTLSFNGPTSTVNFNQNAAGPYGCKVQQGGYVLVKIGGRPVLLPYFDIPETCEPVSAPAAVRP